MPKVILMSIKPKYVAEILNHRKTIEIRKTAPKCALPIDVYIYCTKTDYICHISEKYVGKVVAKFTLREVEKFDFISERKYEDNPLKYNEEIRKHNRICKEACVSPVEVVCYLDTKYLGSDNSFGMFGYAWHISDLEIFDEPKELWRFQKPGTHDQYLRSLQAAREDDLKLCEKYGFDQWDMYEENVVANGEELTEEAYKMGAYGLQRPPQSWQYVEEG